MNNNTTSWAPIYCESGIVLRPLNALFYSINKYTKKRLFPIYRFKKNKGSENLSDFDPESPGQ